MDSILAAKNSNVNVFTKRCTRLRVSVLSTIYFRFAGFYTCSNNREWLHNCKTRMVSYITSRKNCWCYAKQEDFIWCSFRAGVHNSYLMAGQNFFLPHPRAKMYMFLPIQRVFFKANKVNTKNFGLCGPNRKPPRASFGPWAVCCAPLV